MILYLNTSDLHKVEFKIFDGKKVVAMHAETLDAFTSHKILEHLEKFLRKTRTSGPKLTAVTLYIGPGSHTGLRVGSAIGQSLSLGWGTPFKTTRRLL